MGEHGGPSMGSVSCSLAGGASACCLRSSLISSSEGKWFGVATKYSSSRYRDAPMGARKHCLAARTQEWWETCTCWCCGHMYVRWVCLLQKLHVNMHRRVGVLCRCMLTGRCDTGGRFSGVVFGARGGRRCCACDIVRACASDCGDIGNVGQHSQSWPILRQWLHFLYVWSTMRGFSGGVSSTGSCCLLWLVGKDGYVSLSSTEEGCKEGQSSMEWLSRM